jgi:hypothetical protein
LVKAHLGPAIFLVMAASGMIIDGVLGSEAIDSFGEVLDVEGADISDVDKGTLLLNWEHEPGREGRQYHRRQGHRRQEDLQAPPTVRTTASACTGSRFSLPFIYGICRLFDGAGHENAKAIAAIVRDNAANNEPWSVGTRSRAPRWTRMVQPLKGRPSFAELP